MAWVKPSNKHQKKLKGMKSSVESAWIYWRNNYNSYNFYRKFFYKSSLDEQEIASLNELNKPPIQINLGEVNISRLMGEFANHEPGIECHPAYDKPVDPMQLKMVEGYIRHILTDSKKKNYQYKIMEDLYSGGWSVGKVRTDYINSRSFNQDILVERVHEPTLTGFDPMARESNKSDGEFCFEYFPMSKELFKKNYKEVSLENVQYTQAENGFSWSYKADNGKTEVVVVCDYYKKKRKKFTIVELTPTDPSKPGQVMKKSEYLEELKNWSSIEQPPAIINERITEEVTIVRYRFMEDTVLEVEDMDFKDFPLVFIDGNSKLLRETEQGNFEQFTRPYLYHVRDAQRLLNFSISSLGAQIENISMARLLIAEESLPSNDDYIDAITTPQISANIIYKGFKDDNPEIPTPPPIQMEPAHIPPEIMATINMSMSAIQSILGSFDAAQGSNSKRISNESLITSITQSNSTAQPYLVGYLQGLDHIAQMIVYLIPRYILNPRILPFKDKKGNNGYQTVNVHGKPSMKYEDNSIHVTVSAGISFASQQQQALDVVTSLMKENEIIGQFMATKGLKFLFENVDFKGKDELIGEIQKFQQEMEKQKANQQNQPTPEMLKHTEVMAKIAQDAKNEQTKLKIHEDQIEQDKRDNQVEILEIQKDLAIAHEREHSANVNSHADRILGIHDQKHRHGIERAEIEIKHKSSNNPSVNFKKPIK